MDLVAGVEEAIGELVHPVADGVLQCGGVHRGDVNPAVRCGLTRRR
jgi:hypothetical protein